MASWIVGCVLIALAAVGTGWWVRRSLAASGNDRSTTWRSTLNRIAGRLAVFTCVLVVLLSTLFTKAPYALVQGLTMLAALCAAVVVMAWLTASVVGGRRGRRAWLLAPVWAALALGGTWMVGYAMALRGNLIKYAGGVHDLTPFGYGAWFGVLVLVLGVLHLRWLRGLTGPPQ